MLQSEPSPTDTSTGSAYVENVSSLSYYHIYRIDIDA